MSTRSIGSFGAAFVVVVVVALAPVACGGGSKGTTGAGASTSSTSSSGATSTSSASTSGVGTSSSGASSSSASSSGDGGPGCGYEGKGTPVQVAANIQVCLPPVVCNAETCPPPLGQCVSGICQFGPGYAGIRTLAEAWATHYCALSTGGCHGVTQIQFPEITAATISQSLGHPLCDQSASDQCIGIMASSPMMVGNSQEAVDPATGMLVADWGLGLTEASGLCYEITGPGGTAIVAATDRCGGYCKCNGSAFQECGPCVNAPSMVPNCPCVGTAPTLYTQCCGDGCATLNAQCDWCANNNHPHFDLDDGTFGWVCGAQATNGSCQLTTVKYIPCLGAQAWPPGGGGGTCKANSFQCASTPAAHQDAVPGTTCCCNYNACPQADGSCAAAPSTCKTGSCACAAGEPDANHPSVPSTGCCCTFGTTPQADGSCQ